MRKIPYFSVISSILKAFNALVMASRTRLKRPFTCSNQIKNHMGQKILIYVGAHHGNSLAKYVNNYDKVYAFEANPDFCHLLRKKFASHSHVMIINAAICEKHNSIMEFNISKNDGESSSLLEANKESELYPVIQPCDKISVPTINLLNFFEENKIQHVTSYVSDLQGYDFIVLKTLKPFIEKGLIEEIQCEVEKDDKPPYYINNEVENQNKEKNFDAFLPEFYVKVAKGWGVLEEGNFSGVPEDWGEQDIKWKLKPERSSRERSHNF